MKTLYINDSSNVLVDTEANTANKLESLMLSVNRIYLAKEPMHIVYGIGEYKKELYADKDDIIITFYYSGFKNKIIVVKNKDWTENLIEYNKREQQEKERWASEETNKLSEDNG